MSEYLTVTDCAKRWNVSTEKASRILRKYVGRGVLDLGARENVRKRKRGYAILRVPPQVLDEIERDLS